MRVVDGAGEDIGAVEDAAADRIVRVKQDTVHLSVDRDKLVGDSWGAGFCFRT
jgi:hypothetical protein